MKKTTLSILLALFLILATALPALASPGPRPVTTAQELLDALAEIGAGGGTHTLLLQNDIELRKEVRLSQGDVTLLGDGVTLTLGPGGTLSLSGTARLRLGAPGQTQALTLRSTDDTRCILALSDQAGLELYDGVTLGPSRSGGQAGGVQLKGSATMHMYGGTIAGCENWASVAGGVLLTGQSSFELHDGTITGCSGWQGGAVGVCDSASFTMHDGSILDSTDHWLGGGGACVYGTAASFTMHDGTISGCSADGADGALGGGVFYYTRTGSMQLLGGTIGSNRAGVYGGGVYVHDGAATIADGVRLFDNTAGTAGDDLYWNGGALTLGAAPTGEVLTSTGRTIDGWYRDGNAAGDLRWARPADTDGDGFADLDGDGQNDLASDGTLDTDGDGQPDLAAGAPFVLQADHTALTAPAALKAAHPLTFQLTYESAGGTEYDPEHHPAGTVVELDKVPARSGYQFTGWHEDAELTSPVTEVLLDRDRTVYASWKADTTRPPHTDDEDDDDRDDGQEDEPVAPTPNPGTGGPGATPLPVLAVAILAGGVISLRRRG